MSENSVVNDLPALEKQMCRLLDTYGGREVMVEEYVDGREFNATVIGNSKAKVLEVSEIVFTLAPGRHRILTYAGKWEPESEDYRGTKPVCPARISEDEKRLIAGAAEKAFVLTGCRGYARVDMRMDERGRLSVIEVNPNPDISPDSGAALQARAAGLDYKGFIGKIVALALEARR